MKDEEIEKLINLNKHCDFEITMTGSKIFRDNAEALRQLHDEVKALRKDARRLDWMTRNRAETEFWIDERTGKDLWGVTITGPFRQRMTCYEGETLREAIDAALSQEDR